MDRPIDDNVDIPIREDNMLAQTHSDKETILITALLSTDFDGYHFKLLGDGNYSMTDEENTIVLKSVDDDWETWVDGSLCIKGELESNIDWIGEYA
jgi:hypothetical protein